MNLFQIFDVQNSVLTGDAFTREAPDLLMQAAWAVNATDGVFSERDQGDNSDEADIEDE